MLESKLDALLTEEQKRQVNSKHTQQP